MAKAGKQQNQKTQSDQENDSQTKTGLKQLVDETQQQKQQIQNLLDKIGELEVRISKLNDNEEVEHVDYEKEVEKALLNTKLEDVICMDTFSQKVASAIKKGNLTDNPIDYVKIDPDQAFQDCLSYAMKVLLSNQQPSYFTKKKNTRASMVNVISLAKVMFEEIAKEFQISS